MRGIVHNGNCHVYAAYDSVAKAEKAVNNTQCLGWKLKGRFINEDARSSLVVSSSEEFKALDVDVIVHNCLTGKPVTLRKSECGGPCDPSTERYHSM